MNFALNTAESMITSKLNMKIQSWLRGGLSSFIILFKIIESLHKISTIWIKLASK